MRHLSAPLRLCASALIVSALASRGQTPVLAWDAEASAARPAQADVYRGETVALRPAFLERGAPADTNGAAFTLYWQTNGMGAAWWSDPADAFRWTPARDCGAAAYTLFIRCDTAAGASYRANARLRMLDSPGAAPNMIPLPALAIDFSAVSYLNAPWLTAAAWLSGSNALAGAAQALGPRIDALEGKTADWDAAYGWGDHAAAGYLGTAAWQSWLGTNTLRADLTNEAALREAADNTLSTGKLDAAATVGWETGSHASFLTSAPPQSVVSVNGLTGAVEITAAQIGAVPYTGATQTVNLGGNDLVVGNDLHIGDDAFVGGHIEVDGRIELLGGGRYITGASYISGLVPLNSDTWHLSDRAVSGAFLYSNLRSAVDEAIWTADYRLSWWASTNGLASTQQVADAVAPLATAEQAAAVVRDATNALVQTYLLGSNAWMIVSNDVLRIWQVAPTNAAQTNLLWQSGDAFPPAATQTLWSAVLQLTQDLDAKGGRAWGNYAPDGSDNPDPAYMTFLNAPAAVFASGAQWSTYGTYAVLTATGTVAFASGGDGQFRIGPNSTNWFGYVQGGSVTVGAVPDSLAVTGGGETGGYAEIVYAYSGGDFPALWFTPSLSLDFTEVSGAVWVDNLDGTATATAPAESAGGFWFATTTVTLDNYFKSTMPARLDGGVVGSTNAVPVVYDSVITISSGGKNYRIPAQEVE